MRQHDAQEAVLRRGQEALYGQERFDLKPKWCAKVSCVKVLQPWKVLSPGGEIIYP
jgi:hypothetical protein